MSKIIYLDQVTKLDLPVERILDGAKEADLDQVIVMGHDKDGEVYFASSNADGGDVMWLMELCKKKLLEYIDG